MFRLMSADEGETIGEGYPAGGDTLDGIMAFSQTLIGKSRNCLLPSMTSASSSRSASRLR